MFYVNFIKLIEKVNSQGQIGFSDLAEVGRKWN